MKIEAENPDEYLTKVPDERREPMEQLPYSLFYTQNLFKLKSA